jgi:spore coat protein H
MNLVRLIRCKTLGVGGILISAVAVLAAADSNDAFFTNGPVSVLRIAIPPENIEGLRNNPRQYIRASVRAGTNVWNDVGVHIKGSIGSFRSIDGKPSLTLSFDKYSPQQRFHDLRKIHLNNSVEDASYMNELLGNEFFRRAGLPAPRVAHAVVEINDRRVGLYVLKEGFAEEFLARYFRHPDGNLYDITKDGHDVNEPLEKAMGKGPDDRSDLEALAFALDEPDLARRWQQLQKTLDVDRFLSFMAMEILLGHRDGYCLARNNFRVYQDVDSNRFVFFPHGMDVLFGNARAPIQPMMNGVAAKALMEIPVGRSAYRQRCALLFTNILSVSNANSIIDQALPRVSPVLNGAEGAALNTEVKALRLRIAERIASLDKQFQQNPMQQLPFQEGVAKIGGWQAVDIPDGGNLAATSADGKSAFTIVAGPVTSASWRAKVLLPRGRYQFEATAKTSGVEPLPFGKNHGVMLRVVGAKAARPQPLLGDEPWSPLSTRFEVTEREAEIELVCELRARKGTAWFDAGSLRLVRVQ